MANKQDQDVGNGSIAVQSAGNVTIEQNNQGLAVAEVKELTNLFLKENFPKLREEAILAATENVKEYLKYVEKEINEHADSLNVSKLSDPDIQSSLNESVQSSARKGNKIDLQLLAESVIQRVRNIDNDVLDLVAEEAIRIIPKLNRTQINFLTLAHYIAHVSHNEVKNIQELDSIIGLVVNLTQESFGLTEANKQYLASMGVLTLNRIASANRIQQMLHERYPFLPSTNSDIDKKYSNLQKIIGVYSENDMSMVFLTTVGQYIGILNLQRIFGKLDFSIWIK